MRRDFIRLSRRHQMWFYSTFGVLFLSGVFLLILHNYFTKAGDFGVTPHPMEPWWLKVHGAAAMAALIVLGTLLPNHVRRSWNARRNRASGIGILGANGVLILSGYALYYSGDNAVRQALGVLHWILGLLLPIILVWHIWRGRISRR